MACYVGAARRDTRDLGKGRLVYQDATHLHGPLGLALAPNGDLLTTLDYRKLFDHHRASGAAATIAMHRRSVKIDFGVVETGAGGDLERYIEKPEYHYSVSMGINILEPVALGMIASGESLGMPDLMLRLKAAGHRVATYEAPCRWLDIGRVDDYAKAQEEFAENAETFLGAGA